MFWGRQAASGGHRSLIVRGCIKWVTAFAPLVDAQIPGPWCRPADGERIDSPARH